MLAQLARCLSHTGRSYVVITILINVLLALFQMEKYSANFSDELCRARGMVEIKDLYTVRSITRSKKKEYEVKHVSKEQLCKLW